MIHDGFEDLFARYRIGNSGSNLEESFRAAGGPLARALETLALGNVRDESHETRNTAACCMLRKVARLDASRWSVTIGDLGFERRHGSGKGALDVRLDGAVRVGAEH